MVALVPYLNTAVWDEDDPSFSQYAQIALSEQMDVLKAEAETYRWYLCDRYPSLPPADLRVEIQEWWRDRKAQLLEDLRREWPGEPGCDDTEAPDIFDFSVFRNDRLFREVSRLEAKVEGLKQENADLKAKVAESERKERELLDSCATLQENMRRLESKVAECEALIEYLSPGPVCPECGASLPHSH